MSLTEPVSWLEKPFEGYVLNTSFSEANTEKISTLMKEIEEQFGEAVFVMPKTSLHITLLDWVAPLVDYNGQDKEEIYKSIKMDYDAALSSIVSKIPPIEVHFTEVRVYPTTIILLGYDNGQFQQIRDKFTSTVELIPDTKQPPTIIHSSIARFKQAIPVSEVEAFLAPKHIDIVQTVNNFRLVHTIKEPMLDFEVIKNYQLS